MRTFGPISEVDTTRPANAARIPSAICESSEETLVADARAGLTPSEAVEQKLATLLKGSPLLCSHLRTARTTQHTNSRA